MSKLIIANWKKNPASAAEAIALAQATDHDHLVICPPFTFLSVVGAVLKKAKLGAQDFSAQELKDSGAEYVIIGHSERRINLGETGEVIAKKLLAAAQAGLIPILCVGETWEEKQTGAKEEKITNELKIDLSLLPSDYLGTIYIAYEPIWAISTNKNSRPDKPEDTLETIAFMKNKMSELDYKFNVHYLYGGSVNSKNASAFLDHNEIEGALIGGASLKPEEMSQIMQLV